jgi:uncharacterized protein YndB with AHSA1/START domain
MNDIEKNVLINAPIDAVWAALTDPVSIGGWMDDDKVEVDLKVGGRYALFGGETTGAFARIEQPNYLEYTWRQSSWREEWTDSLVRWELRAAPGGTQVKLVHSRFPNDEERDGHDEGWDTYFLGPLEDWLEADAGD